MSVKITSPDRSAEISAEIADALDAPANIETIRSTLRRDKEGYDRCNAPDIKITTARKRTRRLVKKLDDPNSPEWLVGRATFNPSDEPTEAHRRDQRFDELRCEFADMLRDRADYWPVNTSHSKTREYIEGSPKDYIANIAVKLIVQYQLKKLSMTPDGLTCKVAGKIYDLFTGESGDEERVGMSRHVCTAVRQYRKAKKTAD